MTLTETTAVAAASRPAADSHGYVDWPAIIAGAVLASAISFVLFAFGAALGLSFVPAGAGEERGGLWWGIAIAIWVLWVAVSSFMAGAYVTGRLRRRLNDATAHEADIRDSVHGLLVWALAVLIGLGAAGMGVSRGLDAVGPTVATIEAGTEDGIYETTLARLGDRLLMPTPNAPAAVDPQAREAVGRVLLSRGLDGTFSDADKTYLTAVVMRHTGATEVEAQARINRLEQDVEAAAETARQAAEAARNFGVLFGFLTAATLAVCAAAASVAARRGGQHRDEGTVLGFLVRVRRAA